LPNKITSPNYVAYSFRVRPPIMDCAFTETVLQATNILGGKKFGQAKPRFASKKKKRLKIRSSTTSSSVTAKVNRAISEKQGVTCKKGRCVEDK